jgi:uncharacterized protein
MNAGVAGRGGERQWPEPSAPHAMVQRWENLLFAHWRVDPAALATRIPRGLHLDVRDSGAWVAVTPFVLSGLRLRGLPQLPGASTFPELNVRTYVTAERKPGVWFFSLDAGSPLAAFFGRKLYHLPYFAARMSVVEKAGRFSYRCDRGRPGVDAEFLGDYAPIGEAFRSLPGSMEEWLTARYCLYSEQSGTLFRAEIAHEPWSLQRAEAEIVRNTMAHPSGIELPPDRPLLHFARSIDVRIWWPEKVGRG